MSSINSLIGSAELAGRYDANRAHGDDEDLQLGICKHHSGDGTGRLVLEAYRNHGVEEMNSVVRVYQSGYNTRVAELGDFPVRTPQIKHGLRGGLLGATDEEEQAIIAALKVPKQPSTATTFLPRSPKRKHRRIEVDQLFLYVVDCLHLESYPRRMMCCAHLTLRGPAIRNNLHHEKSIFEIKLI